MITSYVDSGLDEVEQVGVELLGVRGEQAVRGARVDLQLRALDDLRRSGRAEASIGTIWSSSPWITSVGTSIRSQVLAEVASRRTP